MVGPFFVDAQLYRAGFLPLPANPGQFNRHNDKGPLSIPCQGSEGGPGMGRLAGLRTTLSSLAKSGCRRPSMMVPQGPGLGIEFDERKLQEIVVA